MQKFLITNGKSWIMRGTVNGVKTTNSAAFAKEFHYEQGRKVILAHKSLNDYYLEGVDDYMRIPKDVLIKNKHDISVVSDAGDTDILLGTIDGIVSDILSIRLPSKKDLIKQKDTLLQKQQWYDLALSDIEHWAQYHKPPAHICTKVFKYLSEYRVIRAEIKEKMRYIDVMLNFYDTNNSFSGIVGELKKATDATYKPDTSVYAELDALLKK